MTHREGTSATYVSLMTEDTETSEVPLLRLRKQALQSNRQEAAPSFCQEHYARCPRRQRRPPSITNLFGIASQPVVQGFEIFVLSRALVIYDVATDILVTCRIDRIREPYWFFCSIVFIVAPVFAKAIVFQRVVEQRMSESLFITSQWVIHVIYWTVCLAAWAVVDLYLLLLYPWVQPSGIAFGMVGRLSPLIGMLEGICQSSFQIYMYSKLTRHSRHIDKNMTHLLLFSFVPCILGIFKRMSDLTLEACNADMNLCSYTMELVNGPMGLTAPFLTLLTRRTSVSYANMGSLTDSQQDQIFLMIGAKNKSLREIEFDGENSINFSKLAEGIRDNSTLQLVTIARMTPYIEEVMELFQAVGDESSAFVGRIEILEQSFTKDDCREHMFRFRSLIQECRDALAKWRHNRDSVDEFQLQRLRDSLDSFAHSLGTSRTLPGSVHPEMRDEMSGVIELREKALERLAEASEVPGCDELQELLESQRRFCSKGDLRPYQTEIALRSGADRWLADAVCALDSNQSLPLVRSLEEALRRLEDVKIDKAPYETEVRRWHFARHEAVIVAREQRAFIDSGRSCVQIADAGKTVSFNGPASGYITVLVSPPVDHGLHVFTFSGEVLTTDDQSDMPKFAVGVFENPPPDNLGLPMQSVAVGEEVGIAGWSLAVDGSFFRDGRCSKLDRIDRWDSLEDDGLRVCEAEVEIDLIRMKARCVTATNQRNQHTVDLHDVALPLHVAVVIPSKGTMRLKEHNFEQWTIDKVHDFVEDARFRQQDLTTLPRPRKSFKDKARQAKAKAQAQGNFAVSFKHQKKKKNTVYGSEGPIKYCKANCPSDAYGFFYQMDHKGHEIVGYFFSGEGPDARFLKPSRCTHKVGCLAWKHVSAPSEIMSQDIM